MPLALSPADQAAIAAHALSPAAHTAITAHAHKFLFLMLGGTVVLRGHVTAWMLDLANLLRTDTAPVRPTPTRRSLPAARRRKPRRAS